MKSSFKHCAIKISVGLGFLLLFFILKQIVFSVNVMAQTCGDACISGNCASPYTCDSRNVCINPTEGCVSCSVSGSYGACEASMACPQSIQQEGSCNTGTPSNPYDICCTPSQNPTTGTRGCGQSCLTTSDCQTNLFCDSTSGRCTGSGCPTCSGLSGDVGICLDPSLCENLGYAFDGDGSCQYPLSCCTDTSESVCNISLASRPQVNSEVRFDLVSNSRNTRFYIATSPTGCVSITTPTTDSNGVGAFAVNCPLGNFTVYASTTTFPETAPDSCSLTVNFVAFPDPLLTPVSQVDLLCGNGSINTAIGCLPVGDRNAFLAFILRWAIGISGGVSFLFIVYSGFIIMTATGDKRKVQAGRELLTAAVSGILLLIFSVFILDFIGIRILRIPGL